MSNFAEFAHDFAESLEERTFHPPVPSNSYYVKPNPEKLQSGQLWLAQPLTRWESPGDPIISIFIVLTHVDDQACKGFLVLDGLDEKILSLAESIDVQLPFEQSPIDNAVIMTWRGEINLLPNHLQQFFGNVPEEKLHEAMSKYVPFITQQILPSPPKPALEPLHKAVSKFTEIFDAETLSALP